MMRRLFMAVALFSLCIFASAPVAKAFDPFNSVDCAKDGSNTSSVCVDKAKTDNPIAGSNGIIIKVTRVIAIVAGIAAIILMLVGGLKYVVSNGDSNGINSAKNTILYAALGLVIIVLAQTIITYVVSRL